MSILGQFGAVRGSEQKFISSVFGSSLGTIFPVNDAHETDWISTGSVRNQMNVIHTRPDVPLANDGSYNYWESSWIQRLTSTVSPLAAQVFARFELSGASSSQPSITIIGRAGDDGGNYVLQIETGNGAVEEIDTPYLFTQNESHAITVRTRSESKNAAGEYQGDGAIEVWINGDILMFGKYDYSWGSPSLSTTFIPRTKEFLDRHENTIRGGSSGGAVRDVVFRDDWTGAVGEAPGIPYVVDRSVETLTQLGNDTWLPLDGTPFEVDDLNGFDDVTGIGTEVIGDEMVLGMSQLPANTDAYPKGDTVMSLRASRNALSPNEFTMQPTSFDGAAGAGAPVTLSLTTASPIRGIVNVNLGVVGTNDLHVKVTNGDI